MIVCANIIIIYYVRTWVSCSGMLCVYVGVVVVLFLLYVHDEWAII